MKIELEYADVVDRYLISCIKYEKIKTKDAWEQKEYYSQFVDNSKFAANEYRLHEIHRQLWNAEDYIRVAIEGGDKDHAFEWAKDICQLNDERSAIKKELGGKDTKFYKVKKEKKK